MEAAVGVLGFQTCGEILIFGRLRYKNKFRYEVKSYYSIIRSGGSLCGGMSWRR